MLRDPGAQFEEYAGTSLDIVDTLAGMHGAEDGLHLTREETHAMEWVDADLAIDGVPRRFRMIGNEQHWLAYRAEAGTWLFVHSRGVSPASIDLVRVDPGPYLSGARRLGG